MFSPCGLPALTNTALRIPFGQPPQPCRPPATDRAALQTRYLPTPCILTARPCGLLRPTRAALWIPCVALRTPCGRLPLPCGQPHPCGPHAALCATPRNPLPSGPPAADHLVVADPLRPTPAADLLGTTDPRGVADLLRPTPAANPAADLLGPMDPLGPAANPREPPAADPRVLADP